MEIIDTSMKRIRFASFLGGVYGWHCHTPNEVHCNTSRHVRKCIFAEAVDQSFCTYLCHISSIVIIIHCHLGNSHRVIDNMPVTWCYTVANSAQPFCTTRFPVGCYVTHSGKPHDACFLSVSIIVMTTIDMITYTAGTIKREGCNLCLQPCQDHAGLP